MSFKPVGYHHELADFLGDLLATRTRESHEALAELADARLELARLRPVATPATPAAPKPQAPDEA